jgi:hypothetical protein
MGPAKWIEIEHAARALVECVEPQANGHWLVRVGFGDRYHTALKMLHDLIKCERSRLEWMMTNGSTPMFAYYQPFARMDGPTPISPTLDVDRYSIFNQGGTEYVLRLNERVLAARPVSPTSLYELQQLAEGAVNLRRTSSGDRQ